MLHRVLVSFLLPPPRCQARPGALGSESAHAWPQSLRPSSQHSKGNLENQRDLFCRVTRPPSRWALSPQGGGSRQLCPLESLCHLLQGSLCTHSARVWELRLLLRLSYCDKEVCSILSRKLQEHARVLSSPWCAAYVHRQVWCVGLHRETLCLGPGEETQPSRRTSDTLRACWATWSSPLASHKKQH